MSDTIRVPVKTINRENWGVLDCWGNRTIDVVAEQFKKIEDKFSFGGGHRVRLIRLWDKIHFKIPSSVPLDISAVAPAKAPIVRRHDRPR